MSVTSRRPGLTHAFLVCTLLSLLAGPGDYAQSSGSAPTPRSTGQPLRTEKLVLYAAVGPELSQYEVDVEGATLVKRGSVSLPGAIQYAWPHPSREYLYVAWSNGALGQHGVSALGTAPALRLLGPATSLRSRPIHVSTDISGTHLLVAYNNPSSVTVHRIAANGTIASQVDQAAPLDVGVYAHQVRVDPSDRVVILVTRGNGRSGDKPEDPGALKTFRYQDGLLTNLASVAPGRGLNFQPRHLDFHPTGPWVFVSLERQNKLQVYRKSQDQLLGPTTLFTKDSLADPGHPHPGQLAGTVHVHPNGRFLYQANRASNTIELEGKSVFAGGENNIAVYSVNQETGEPVLVQNADTRGLHPRTFALDPSGRILVAANQMSLLVRDGGSLNRVPASLAVYRIRNDGKLDFVRKYDVETGGGSNLMWVGIVALP